MAKERFGGIDTLIKLNAGAYDGAFAAMNSDEYASLIQCNLAAPVLLTIAARDALIALPVPGAGEVVMMASMAGITGKEGQVPYSATKGGLMGATRLLAVSCGRGVRVNALAPGFITEMVEI